MSETPKLDELFQNGMDMMMSMQRQTAAWATQAFEATYGNAASGNPFNPAQAAAWFENFQKAAAEYVHLDALFGVDRAYTRFFAAAQALLKVSAEYQTFTGTTWSSAWQQYLATRPDGGDRPDNLKDTMEEWLAHANKMLLQSQRSEGFKHLQRRLVEAVTEFRESHRAVAELYLEQVQVPTRTEMDDLSRSLYELKREMRQLRRETDTLKQELVVAKLSPANRSAEPPAEPLENAS